jgi:hypothetical protein
MQQDGNAPEKAIMYIRGVPFACPPSGTRSQSQTETVPTGERKHSVTAGCSNGPLARWGTTTGTRIGITRAEATLQAELLQRRRSVRVFSSQAVPMRVLRDLISAAGCPGPDTLARSARFIMVEAPSSMARITGLTAAWLRREGLLLDGPKPEANAQHAIFGGAPHIAVAYGPAAEAQTAAVCALAVARLEWLATVAGIGTSFAGELVQAAACDPELAAALALPANHTVYAALLLGYPAFPANHPVTAHPTRIIWL